ncbi:hypothetical protein [Variovorax rhizosphaerae]|uniref:Phage late control D family protein n=1 Tax=Variovorax rhizosphaerae TaxID=1836200 RepID=A0ABU8WPR1_9BURK
MSLSKPGARITIDGTELGADEAALLRLTIEMSVNGRHDHALLRLWPRSKFADAAAGATISIALGERGSEQAVFSGEVGAGRRLPNETVVEALAATVRFSRAYKSQTYVGQTVADIVRDLADGAPIDQVEATLKLNAYYVDNARPVWSQLQTLARLVGADLGCAPDGGLRFVPAAGAAAPTQLRYGAELLDWNLARATAPQSAAVAAYGAASEQGDARWHWIAHDPVGAGGTATRLPAALATRDGAQAVADAMAARAGRAAVDGELLIVGAPKLRPGDSVQLSDLPGGDPGVLRIRSLRHGFDGRSGFMTRLRVEAGEGGGLGGLP